MALFEDSFTIRGIKPDSLLCRQIFRQQIETGKYSAGACTRNHIEVVGKENLRLLCFVPLQTFFFDKFRTSQ
jgi:hypothetical protein